MKKFLSLFIVIVLLISCKAGNLYQDIGIAEKPKLIINSFSVYHLPEDGKVNLFSLFDADSALSFPVTFEKAEESKGKSYLLKTQNETQLNKMTELLMAPCFSISEINSYLNSPVEDLVLLDSIANAEAALTKTEASVMKFIDGLSSLKLDSSSSLSEKDIEEINNYISKMQKALSSFFSEFYDSLNTFIQQNQAEWKWSDYLRMQLTLNLIGGVLQGINASYLTIEKTVNSSETQLQSFDFSKEEDINAFLDYMKTNIGKTGKTILVNFVSSLIDPLACYIQITERLKNNTELGLVTVDDVVSLILGEKK